MCGPCARKGEEAEKTRFCSEGCCTPKVFSNIWWGIFCVFIVLQVIGFFVTPVSLFTIIGLVINVLIVIVYVMSLIKPDELSYRSVLSYIADVAFGFGCVGYVLFIILWIFGGAAVSSAVDYNCELYPEYCDAVGAGKDSMFIVMLIIAICYAAWLWLSFWAACQIREAVFRMKWNKGESFDGVFQKA